MKKSLREIPANAKMESEIKLMKSNPDRKETQLDLLFRNETAMSARAPNIPVNLKKIARPARQPLIKNDFLLPFRKK
jgi:hypothetical protein